MISLNLFAVSSMGTSQIHQLVDILSADPTFVLDLRYATENNFTHEVLYQFPKSPICYLHKDVAEALAKVQKEFALQGLRLKVFDGYRPLAVQQKMWDLIQDERYVSNPAVNKGRHTRGTAVDVTLIDLQGSELEMPTPFDDFSSKAHADAKEGISEKAIQNRELLKEVMSKYGFEQLPTEWWHFDYRGWNSNQYPSLDLSFTELIEN